MILQSKNPMWSTGRGRLELNSEVWPLTVSLNCKSASPTKLEHGSGMSAAGWSRTVISQHEDEDVPIRFNRYCRQQPYTLKSELHHRAICMVGSFKLLDIQDVRCKNTICHTYCFRQLKPSIIFSSRTPSCVQAVAEEAQKILSKQLAPFGPEP